MSYILDALKKSEQERQRGTVPDLLTVQEEMLPPPRRRPRWRYAAAAGILLGVGASAWLLLPLKSDGPTVPAVTQQPVVPVAMQNRDIPEPAQPAPVAEKKAEDSRLPVAGDKGRIEREAIPERSLFRKEDAAPALQDTVKPVVTAQQAAIPPPDPGKVYRLKELPAALQKALPSFSLSAFMYSSNPELRMVRINGQMMREDQELTAGIRLQEITTDGVILASQGYRFFIGMK